MKTKLKVIPDDRGYLLEVMRADDPGYSGFGQVYVTATYDGIVKGFHLHRFQTDNITCVVGMIKLVVMTPPTDCDIDWLLGVQGAVFPPEYFKEYYIGELNPTRVTIPPGTYHGWRAIGDALVINIPDRMYDYDDPDEYRVDPHSIGYNWDVVDK